MAKPTTYATPICLVLTLLAIIGIVLGLWKHSPLITTLLLLPTVGYEAYRTQEGASTKWTSWFLLFVLIAEVIFIIFHLNYDLAKFFGKEEQYLAGYWMPLGDIKVVTPALMAILSIILFFRTYGPYTKWLSVIIFITSFALVYILSPQLFQNFLRFGIDQGLYHLY